MTKAQTSDDAPRHHLDRCDVLKILGFAAAGTLLFRAYRFKPSTDVKEKAVTQVTDFEHRVVLSGIKRGAEDEALINAVKEAARTATDFGWLSKGDAVLIKPALNSGNSAQHDPRCRCDHRPRAWQDRGYGAARRAYGPEGLLP